MKFFPSLGACGVLLTLFARAVCHGQSGAVLDIERSSPNGVQLKWQPQTGFERLQSSAAVGTSGFWQFVTNSPDFSPPFVLLNRQPEGAANFFRLIEGSQPIAAPAQLPDPKTQTVAPLPNSRVSFVDSTAFLYSSSNAVQIGVAPGTIQGRRAAVLRGRILLRDGSALGGVHVAVADHPELGFTYSRGDGMYDLGVNGGGLLTVDFQLKGYVPAHRQILAPQQAFRSLPDLFLVPLDPIATVVVFGTNSPAQLASSTPRQDGSGTRTARLFFPAGTCASLIMPDGSTQSCTGLTIRMTELTVGTNGPAAMPAALPPSSAYTYCAEMTADEALEAGATAVVFNQPVFMYVNDFLHFGPGALIPSGYYDRQRARWVATDNGIVIGITETASGVAQIDLDGDDIPESSATLASLNFTNDELARLAATYGVNSRVARVPITHFSARDNNCAPNMGNNAAPLPPGAAPQPSNANSKGGYGTLRTARGIFEETIPLPHIPFELNYSSARVPDYRSDAEFKFPVVGQTVPPDLQYARVVSDIGGVRTDSDVKLLPNETATVAWDGSWAYGEKWPGMASVRAGILLNFGYPLFYSGKTLTSAVQQLPLFAQYGSLSVSAGHAGGYTEVFTTFERVLTIPDHRVVGLGGWSAGPQHFYDPVGQILYLGDGSIRHSPPLADNLSVATSLLNRNILSLAPLSDGSCYLFLDRIGTDSYQIVHWFPNQPVEPVTAPTVAGGYVPNTSLGIVIAGNHEARAEGFAANSVILGEKGEIAAGPDDSLYFTGANTIWHIDRAGSLHAVLQGGPFDTFQPDGSYAATSAAGGATPVHISIGPDGTVFYTENPLIGGRRYGLIRRIGGDGRIYTIAGQGGPSPDPFHADFPQDGGYWDLGFDQPAYDAHLQAPLAICAARDGTIYAMTGALQVHEAGSGFILRITPSGLLERALAGVPQTYDGFPNACADLGDCRADDDGTLAVSAGIPNWNVLNQGSGLSEGPDGSIYFTEETPIYGIGGINVLWQITRAGYVRRVAGTWFGAKEGLGRTVSLGVNTSISQAKIGPDGTLFATSDRNPTLVPGDTRDFVLLRMNTRTPTFAQNEIGIASDNGSELYVFDRKGRHLRTLNTVTGTTNWLFSYDANNLIVSARNVDGLVTQIQRDASGLPQAIVGPYGQKTTLTVDAQGFLSSVTNPAGETTRLTNSSGGLVTSITGPRGFTYTASYDDKGRLTGATDPVGGSDTLRATLSLASSGTALSTLNVKDIDATPSTNEVDSILLANDTTLTKTVSALGVTNWEGIPITGGLLQTNADGTILNITTTGDPRFPGQSYMVAGVSLQLPGGAAAQISINRSVMLADPNNALSLQGWSNVVTFNGNAYRDVYTASNRFELGLTPEGRQDSLTFDAVGRVIQEQDAGLNPVLTSFDNSGRLISLTYETSSGSRSSTLSYDGLGRLSSITDPLGQKYSFEFNSANRLVRQTFPGGQAIAYESDAEANITGITPPGQPTHHFNYDPVGQLTSYAPPPIQGEESTMLYDYDLNRNLRLVFFPDGEKLSFTRDADQRLTQVNLDSKLMLNCTYDAISGQLTGIETTAGDRMAFQQQGFFTTNITWFGAVKGSFATTYNKDLLPTTEAVNSLPPISFAYDRDRLLTNAGSMSIMRAPNRGIASTTLGVVQEQLAYDELGHLINIATSVGGSNLWSVSLAFDAVDRAVGRQENNQGLARSTSYSYDSANQLSQVSVNGALSATYTYDPNGNRLTRNTETGAYDVQDRILTYGGASFAWNPNGKLKSRSDASGDTIYTYDLRSALGSVSLPDGRTIEYDLDPLGRRTGKKINGVRQRGWLYDLGDRPVAELSGDSSLASQFIYIQDAPTPAYMIRGTNLFALVSDDLGSVRFVIDSGTGTIVQSLDYDEFGRVLSDSNPGFQPFGYAGGLYDPDTGLVRFGARDYSAELGRWTSRDPIGFDGGQVNLYSYVLNDPVNHTDSFGTGPPFPSAVPVGRLGWVGSVVPNLQYGMRVVIQRGSRTLRAMQGADVYAGDRIIATPESASVVEYYLGGATAVQPGHTVEIVTEREAQDNSGTLSEIFEKKGEILHEINSREALERREAWYRFQILRSGATIGKPPHG